MTRGNILLKCQQYWKSGIRENFDFNQKQIWQYIKTNISHHRHNMLTTIIQTKTVTNLRASLAASCLSFNRRQYCQLLLQLLGTPWVWDCPEIDWFSSPCSMSNCNNRSEAPLRRKRSESTRASVSFPSSVNLIGKNH